MLTVIIAKDSIIKQYEQNKALLAPFDSEEIVFCRWENESGSIDEMLPDLENVVSFNVNWRAVVVTDDYCEKLNPFDFVDYGNYVKNDVKLKFDDTFFAKCRGMFECYDQCVNNPLTKLSVALCEMPYFAELIDSDIYALLESKESLLQYVFKRELIGVNVRKLAADLKKFKYDQISNFVSENKADDLLAAIAEKRFTAVFELIPADMLMEFLEFAKVGNCATRDPGYWYALFENTKKSIVYDKLKNDYFIRKPKPKDVLYIALRTFDTRVHNSKVIWDQNAEELYSDFVRYNMYDENIRFLVYDIHSDKSGNTATESLKFQILLQILAMHGNDAFSIMKNKIFLVDMEYNKRELNRTIAKLIAKLKATAAQINEDIFTLRSKKPIEVDNRTARVIFENDIRVPVQTDKEYDTKNLMAQYDIGLAGNCPREEMPYWDEQYHNIRKLFKRFLREPRRAVKKACVVDFKENNKITDVRAIGLNENQREDVEIKLEEEELSMVTTVTTAIYNTAKFNEEIEKADKNIRRGIRQRMTRKKTVVCGLISVLAYLIGFIPMLFSGLNTAGSFSFSLIVTGIAVSLFTICGFVYLFFLKRKLKNRFKHFNYVMSGICAEIKHSLETFSEYLSHACMVMREKSVLMLSQTKQTDDVIKARMLKYNLSKLESEIDRYYHLLMDFSDEDVDSLLSEQEKSQIIPFDNDYTVDREFSYAIFNEIVSKEIEYMLKGHTVKVPMECVEKITLKREELYDPGNS